MTITVQVIRDHDDKVLGTFDYAAVPEIGSEIMILERDWERYGVLGVRHWPVMPGDPVSADQELSPAAVHCYVRSNGTLD